MIKLLEKETIFQTFGQGNHPKRQQAIQLLKQTEFPNSKNEEWKYSDPKAILQTDFQTSDPISLSEDEAKSSLSDQFYRVVLVNGVYSETLSDKISGLKILALNQALEQSELAADLLNEVAYPSFYSAFDALNMAYFQDGVLIEVDDKTRVEKPICLLNFVNASQSVLLQTRNLIRVGREAEVCFVEEVLFSQSCNSFLNHVCEVVVSENAHVEHLSWQDIGQNSVVCSTRTQVNAQASYRHSVLSFSGSYIRNNLNIKIMAENAEVYMNGLYQLEGKDFVDNHTSIDHALPRSYSEQLYKGVLDGSATAVFNGKIFVRQDAQKTNAYQSNKNILLSPSASVNTKPQLEIWANDVKCSHGSTVGALDEEPMFYLRSRGLNEAQARALLLRAYIADVLDKIKNDLLKIRVLELVESKFSVSL
jgi:Fe-S cluster assembly protein SufD